jgi:hypothetical protein
MQLELTSERSQEIPWTMEASSVSAGASDMHRRCIASNIRSVGFIARPEAAAELTYCLEGPVVTLLREMPGFLGAVILHSHREGRNATVLSFWQTEDQALHTRWEDVTQVSTLVYPLVDVCTRVQTFQGTFVQACCEDCKETEMAMTSF